jgi:DNA-binding CsgD family transcriptional regulator/tetratricopeptide (TPR) repeat protein
MTQLVGRARDVSQASGVLARTAQSGEGAILLVTGEAGIGKTAFVTEVAAQAQRLGYAAGLGRAEQAGPIAAGAPLLVALRSGPAPLLSAAQFGGLAPLHAQPLWLADRIADLLDARAQQGPLLLGIDDYQWADPLSRFAVRVLAGRLAGLPVVWLLASRGDARELAAELAGPAVDPPAVHAIGLGPLPPADIGAIAERILGAAPDGPARRWLAGAGGNPFLAVHAAEALAAAAASPDVPAAAGTLAAAVRARLAGVSGPARAAAQLAAVWGRPLGVTDAAALLACEWAPELAGWIAEAAAAGLLAEHGQQVTIRHDLLREALYAATPAAVRAALHRRCAEYLLATGHGALAAAPHMQASAGPGDERAVSVLRAAAAACEPALPETAALLMGQAFALLPPGHPLWIEVGVQYADTLAAIQHGSDVIGVVDTLLPAVTDAGLQARLQVTAARALWRAGLPGEIISRVRAALARPAVPAALEARLAGFAALASTRLGTAQAASAAATAVLATARQLADQPAEQVARQALGEVARNERHHAEALGHFRVLRHAGGDEYLAQETAALRLLDRFDEAQAVMDAASRAADERGAGLLPSLAEARMWQDFMLARFDEADAGARTLARLSDELGTATYRLETEMVAILAAIIRGDLAGARRRLDRALRDDRSDAAVRTPRLQLIASLLAALDGDPRAGLEIIRPVMATASSTRSYWPRLPEWMRVHAGIAIAAGDRDFARQAAARADVAAERNPGTASLAGIAWQVRGLVEGDPRLTRRAVDALASAPRVMLLASALADHGSLLLARGDRTPGIDALQRAWSAYDQHGATRPAAAVAAALARAGVATSTPPAPRRPDTGWAALTGAELAVTALISAGHTNRGAARALGISPNTVATHLRSVFSKLDVRSRVQLANAWHARPDGH